MTPQAIALILDSTGQYVGGPVVGPHDNARPIDLMVRRCLAQLALVGR